MPATANSIGMKNHDNSSAGYTWRPRKAGIEDSMHSMTAYSGPDVLWQAWEEVKANGGSTGVDGVSLEEVERQRVALYLEAIAGDLRRGDINRSRVLRVYIPKPDGRQAAIEQEAERLTRSATVDDPPACFYHITALAFVLVIVFSNAR